MPELNENQTDPIAICVLCNSGYIYPCPDELFINERAPAVCYDCYIQLQEKNPNTVPNALSSIINDIAKSKM